MSNDEFKAKYPLFQSLIEAGKLVQQREDALARIHAANRELKDAQANFHRVERQCITANAVVTAQYQTFFPFEHDECDGSILSL